MWSLSDAKGQKKYAFTPPIFQIDGHPRICSLTAVASVPPAKLANGVAEHRLEGIVKDDPSLSFLLIFRIAPDCPIVRFRYEISSATGRHRLAGPDEIRYLSVNLPGLKRLTEVRLSVFNELFHSYTLSEHELSHDDLREDIPFLGPMLVAEDSNGDTLLVAYEHGSEAPDAFLQFQATRERRLTLRGAKANFVRGSEANGYRTVWMHAGVSSGGTDNMRQQFRRFVLRHMSPNTESRQPYIFYNTWNYQERNKWWNGQTYLQSMNPARILGEIDVAHRLGIEVYVMDTGWYEATGDWRVSTDRFPGGLHNIREKLDHYGMKLGLWFNPTAAARSSSMAAKYRHCVRTRAGQENAPQPVWETESSYSMCLVSPYGDAFADTLIRVAQETGARYFKWDAVGQYGCDSPHHFHGTEANTPEERANSYAFQIPLRMARIVEKLTAAIPDAIVDFDVTEAGRSFGLSFLSAGKYFLINNGPYLFNYDLPLDKEKQNWNLFFYPGPARTWICRSPLNYDRWISSTLLLTHYLPDDPASSQMVNVASLILGQNGIGVISRRSLIAESNAWPRSSGDTRQYVTTSPQARRCDSELRARHQKSTRRSRPKAGAALLYYSRLLLERTSI